MRVPGLQFDARKEPGCGGDQNCRERAENHEVGDEAEGETPAQRASQPIEAVAQRVDAHGDPHCLRQVAQREEGAREEKEGQHDEIHDQREPLRVLEDRADDRADRGAEHGYEDHEQERERQEQWVYDTEAGNHTDDEDDRTLKERDRRSARPPRRGCCAR